MPERLRSASVVLVPAAAVVGLFVFWAFREGGYEEATRAPATLALLGLLVATLIGLGVARVRLSRSAAVALGALAAYVLWSYLSILWAASPGVALDGANRSLLYLMLFALFLVLPWRPWTAAAALSAFGGAIGVVAVIVLVRLGTDDAAAMFADGRLDFPLGYVNGTAAFFTVGAVLAIALASRRELPAAPRALLLAGAAAALQVAVLCASRGWLFALPAIALLTVAIVPARLRLLLWAVPPVVGCLLQLGGLLDVFRSFDAAAPADSVSALRAAADSISASGLVVSVLVGCAGLALALADRRVRVSPRVERGAGWAVATVLAAAVLAGAVAGLAATDGRPDRALADYWDRSQTYQVADPGSSRFALAGSNRPDFWRVALDAALAHPVGGLGQDNWGAYYLAKRRSSEQPRWTHSLELRLLAHTGLVGFLLFALFAAAAVAAALGGRDGGNGPSRRAVRAIALLPLVVWVVHGSVDWFWELPALAGPAFAFAGMAVALGAGARAVTPPRGMGVALALAAAVAAAAVAFPYAAHRDERLASEDWRGDPAAALDRLDRAEALNPLSSGPALAAGLIELQRHRYPASRARLTSAIERDRGNWFLPFMRGIAAGEAGDEQAARADLARARELDPRGALARIALRRARAGKPLTQDEVFRYLRRTVGKLGED